MREHVSKKSFTENGSIPKTVMNDILNDQIGDFENEQRDSNAALFNCRDRFPNGPFGERTLHKKEPWPLNLQTVFSTTQSDHSMTLRSIHAITEIKMLTLRMNFLTGNHICGINRLIFLREFFLF